MPASLPTISIVMPSLNHGAYIEAALRSILDQPYPVVEVIVADGGSIDGTAAILKRFDSRLSTWWSRPDSGPAAALNEGFRHATGDIFGVLNADDFLLPGSLQTVGTFFAAHPGADVAYGHGYFAAADGALGVPAFSDRWDARRFRHGACVLVQPATFFRRRAYRHAGGFRQSGRVCWDMELWADLAGSGAQFAAIDAHLAAFRLHGNSMTASPRLRACRQQDARSVASQFAGAPERAGDRALHYLYRAMKFGRHPIRALRQRWYFRQSIGRWSL
ncbi:MAG TPA: glycosyltransferase family 2 protein [Vicinamibacterales bacterium]|nr:glycosyltransferase family 2 protein [Vicinamibacterales bacterium]